MSAVPRIEGVERAECTVEDDGNLISLYVEINPAPNHSVHDTVPMMDVQTNVDVDETGNVRGIEILIGRS